MIATPLSRGVCLLAFSRLRYVAREIPCTSGFGDFPRGMALRLPCVGVRVVYSHSPSPLNIKRYSRPRVRGVSSSPRPRVRGAIAVPAKWGTSHRAGNLITSADVIASL